MLEEIIKNIILIKKGCDYYEEDSFKERRDFWSRTVILFEKKH
uniref:Uncharacterized protein n=1 Tax=Myoviridae sp. ctaOv25 TaxID=2827290 RepID=A0A8S5R575_9CAUD|nr:MAG TPA: hypothetical protein [Myoviridae sp. ctaOv25]